MAEYIDRDRLEYEILHADFEVVKHLCKDYESYVNGANCFRSKAKNLTKQAPTEDVVPRSELDKFIQEIDQIQKDKADVNYLREQLIANANQEVAREIFDELAEVFKKSENYCKYDICELLFEDLATGICELQKKYIGE